MSWLKLDDGFTKHPKFEGWPPAQRWTWLEVMEYCARYSTKGRIPDDLSLLPRSVTRVVLDKAKTAGWCELRPDGCLWINDWPLYNGSSVAEKVAYYLSKHPDASANDVVKAVGGKREIVLGELRRLRPEGDNDAHA